MKKMLTIALAALLMAVSPAAAGLGPVKTESPSVTGGSPAKIIDTGTFGCVIVITKQFPHGWVVC